MVNYQLPLETRIYIGKRIKRLRKKCGFSTIQSLADMMGLSHNTIGDWESGRISPSVFTIYRLTNVFNCSVRLILPKDIPIEAYKPKKQPSLSKDLVRNRTKHSKKDEKKKNKPNTTFKARRR